MSGLLIAAPSSGSGKTTVTLGLLRALSRRGIGVTPGKAGPDYIDPAFHAIACGTTCLNYDPWAMRPELLGFQASGEGPLVIEAMMGLYDGAADHTGSPASLAKLLDLSVVLVVDCARLSHSVGAMVRGFISHDADLHISGIILNKVGSARHESMLRAGLAGLDVPIFGVIYQDKLLGLPERHLGLVLAQEIDGIEAFMNHAADVIISTCDVDTLGELAGRDVASAPGPDCTVPALGRHVAIARDQAFAFIYPHLMDGWRAEGAEISFFSPLADEGPDTAADAVFLPGGYPELHAGRLSAAGTFRASMLERAASGAVIYGECGGYMTLGEALVDASGTEWPMLGLLPLTTSFATRKRHLGYRKVTALAGPYAGVRLSAHEFHYSTVVHEGQAERLFDAVDAAGEPVGLAGLVRENVSGSYMHLIDLSGGGRLMAGITHGGGLTAACARYGGEPGDWLDLSTGINPDMVALPEIPSAVWNRLPDAALELAAREAARDWYLPARGAPPSVLPDISPSRGEIGQTQAPRSQTDIEDVANLGWLGAVGEPHLISPLEGEMPGRAEGG